MANPALLNKPPRKPKPNATLTGGRANYGSPGRVTIPGAKSGNAAYTPPGIKPPPAPSAPGVPPVKPAFAGDSQYFADVAQERFNNNQKLGDLGTQEGYDRSDTAEALRRRLEQHPKDTQNTNETFNRSGLLFSGQLTKARSEQEQQFERESNDNAQAFDRRQNARLAARQAIEAGQPIAEAAMFAQSVDRKLQADQQAADSGALAGPAAPAQPTRTVPTPTGRPTVTDKARPKKPTRRKRF